MIELLLAFAFWPWVFFVTLILACGSAAFVDSVVIAVVAVVVYGIGIWFLYDANPLVWLINNPGTTILGTMLYCGAGVLWSLFKWRNRMVSDVIQTLMKDAKKTFKENSPDEDVSGYVDSIWFPRDAQPSSNKNRIVSWISLWPFSVFFFVFDDLLRQFFNRLYEMVSGTYQRITNAYLP